MPRVDGIVGMSLFEDMPVSLLACVFRGIVKVEPEMENATTVLLHVGQIEL